MNGRIQGPDDPLTAQGRAQAHRLAPFLAETYAIDLLVASSLARARDTAAIIAEANHAPLAVDARLREIDNGHSIGLLWTDWRAANPDLAAVWGWDVRSADAAWPGGESGRDVCARVFAAFDEIVAAQESTDETIGIVTHGGVIAWLAARMAGDSLDVWPAAWGEIANCSVTEVDISPDGQPYITRWNRTDYLGDTYAPHISPVIPGKGKPL